MAINDVTALISGIVGVMSGIAGVITGIVGICQAHSAQKISKDANSLSEESNRIAKEAGGAAEKANCLASEANKIAGDANLISQRALHATADNVQYDWRVDFDYSSSTVRVRNECPSPARDVTVDVRYRDKTVVEGSLDDCPPFGELALECPLLAEKIREDAIATGNARREAMAHNIYMMTSGGIIDVGIHVVWTSELGKHENCHLDERLSDGGARPVKRK